MKNLLDLVLKFFIGLNPGLAVLMEGGSIVNVVEKPDIDRYAGDIMRPDGTTKVLSVTWKPGTFKGVFGLDPAFAPVTQDEAGTTEGIFLKTDGTPYFALTAENATEAKIEEILGYAFEEGTVAVDTETKKVSFATSTIVAEVDLVVIEAAPVADGQLP